MPIKKFIKAKIFVEFDKDKYNEMSLKDMEGSQQSRKDEKVNEPWRLNKKERRKMFKVQPPMSYNFVQIVNMKSGSLRRKIF